jgi:hypothetical protein
LDRGLAILTLIEVALTAFIVLLLAHVGIAGASNERGCDQSNSQNQTKNGRMPHYKSPGTGAVNAGRLFSVSSFLGLRVLQIEYGRKLLMAQPCHRGSWGTTFPEKEGKGIGGWEIYAFDAYARLGCEPAGCM